MIYRNKGISLVRAAMAACAAAQVACAAGFRAAPLADYREGAWSFGIEAGSAAVGGEAREHVFAPKSMAAEYAQEMGAPFAEGRRHQMSRLDWDIAASMVGASGSARRGRLSLNMGIWYGGSVSGELKMKDYDWMDGDHRPYSEYSKSEAELTDAWMFDANVSFDIVRTDDAALYAFAGAREQRWKWTCDGRNDYWYSENGHVWERDHGHVCDYRQVVFFGYAGLGYTCKLNDTFDLSGYVSWAPGWKGRDRDNHIGAGKENSDSFDYDGNVYSGGVSLDMRIAEKATVSLALDCQKVTLADGLLKQYEYYEDERTTVEGGAGMENEYAALTLSLKYAF